MNRIFLIGPPGSGKTACGQALARLLDGSFYDTDWLIERAQGCTVSEIFASRGQAWFRQLEMELLDTFDSLPAKNGVTIIATGGGLPVYNDNLKKLCTLGKVVALSARLPVLVQRLGTLTDRPLLVGKTGQPSSADLQQRLCELLEQRSPAYARAGYKIDTSNLSAEQVAHEILKLIS